ncbi:MAG: RNA polymerase sigma factor [Candidatus Vogelbacteria bacterium]|nr:RNA polymerase sigma factor [Candidatus Vogelbacteria bacterium]
MYLDEQPTQNNITDEEVLALSLKDPQEFKLIVDRYESAFLRKTRTILGQREEVQDVVAETFTKIYFSAGRFRVIPGANFRSWAYRILVNTAISYYNKLKTRRGDLLTAELDPNLFPDERVAAVRAREEWRDYIASYFHRLPAAAAKILRQFFLEDRSQTEIALAEGISVAAVKTRLHRAKKEFKKSIRQLADPAEL